MASYNPQNNPQNQVVTGGAAQNRGVFSRVLRELSSWGMNYDDMIIKNSYAISINEDPYAQKGYGMYDFFSQKAIASVMAKKSIPYLDRAYPDKRRILREYSIKDEVRDFVTTIADEVVIYGDDKKFCKPRSLPDEYSQEIKNKYQEVFEKVYSKYGFNDGISAWYYIKGFLIDGYLAFEIVYDDKFKNIIHFNQLDPATLVPGYEPTTGKHIWIQYPEDPQLRKILLDSQVVFISYSTQKEYSETSYVEGLIRPYNQLKIIEQTRIMFNMLNAMIYQKFTIPIAGLSRQRAEEQISQLIADYSEEVEWDDSLGTVQINGSKHLPYNKQLWFPEGEGGSPAFELVSPEGHNLNESDMLTWFFNALKRASRIPFSRFDKDNGGGNVFSDASEMTRDEVKFSNFINRLRTAYREIMVKPMKLQMIIEFPELIKDEIFQNAVGVEFNSNDLFEEWKRLNNLQKRSEIVSSMLGSIQTADGQPYFHVDYLVDTILKLTEEEKQANARYKLKGGANATPGEGGAGPDGGGGAGGPEPGGPDLGGAEPGGDIGGAPEGGGEAGPEPGGEEGGGEAGGAGGEEFEF